MLGQYAILRAPPIAGPFRPGGALPHPGILAESVRPESAVQGATVERAELSHAEAHDAANDPTVRAIARVMPTALIRPFDVAAGTEAKAAWGLGAVGADVSAFTGEGVTVAILDTGIDASHTAFAGVTLTEQDFTGSGNGDRHGHGTHCAGTVFGRDVGGTRIGIARGIAQAFIGKVLDDTGGGASDALFQALPWALHQGASVISMSIGFHFPGYAAQLQQSGMPAAMATSMALEAYRGNMRMFDSLMDLVQAQAAFGPSAVVVAAAGNESHVETRPDYRIGASLPAAAQGVVAVGAAEQAQGGLRTADFSNTFPQLSAPGVDILSAKRGGGLASLSGTSMACPHVAGVAALWWQSLRQTHGAANPALVMAKLLGAARPDAFLPSVLAADRGAGLLTAP